ncbi:MAG: glycoside hydrolase family 2 protein [Arachnia sp.]
MPLRELDSGWKLIHLDGDIPADYAAIADGPVPAAVPGVVHTDLLAAHLIPDPYVDDNESALAWIGHCDWAYETTFDYAADGEAHHDLVADGLDTIATVLLNGVEVARTRNQHRSWRWRVDHLLREGLNTLRVEFASPIRYAREREAAIGARPCSYDYPYNTIRKTACNFGWDWGPAVVTSGIWRRIGIEGWSGVRIASVRPVVGVDGDARRVDVHVELEWGDDPALIVDVTATVAGVSARATLSPATGSSAVLPIRAADADLWYPRGHGGQARYELVVTAGDIDAWSKKIGFRTVAIDTPADAHGTAFAIVVNGERIYIRGANWIPEDTFFPRITRQRLAERFADAVEANMNLLRVWGGGLYESEDFYDLADELGVLVWQDFLLACAAYAEDAELWDEFEAEARENVTRLTTHPSLVIWNGNNENFMGYASWGWRRHLNGLTWGDGYYQELFPRVVAELAPTTPYSPGSPYSFSPYFDPNAAAHGTMHIWDVWGSLDYTAYRNHTPRFVSEFGFQGAPAWSTLFSVVHDEPADPYGPTMLVHQKAPDGNGRLERGFGAHIAKPGSIEDWHWATQLNQARAVRFGLEHFRSLHPINQGAVVWQLNDCWPVISWAAVDGHGHRKPLWHALQASYAERLATIQPRDEGLALVLHNDGADEWTAEARVRVLTLDGAEVAGTTVSAHVAARSALTVALDLSADDPATQVLVADLSTGERAFWYFAEDPQLRLDPAAATATAEAVDGGYLVTVEAATLAKDVTLLVDKVHPAARVDRGLVTLLPGERAEFRVSAPAGLDPALFADPQVVRTANDLVPTP